MQVGEEIERQSSPLRAFDSLVALPLATDVGNGFSLEKRLRTEALVLRSRGPRVLSPEQHRDAHGVLFPAFYESSSVTTLTSLVERSLSGAYPTRS